jgi:hypothetical protein
MASVDQDYVIRMIAELGGFLRRVRDLIRLGRIEDALEEIQAGAQSLVGMDVRLFALLDARTLVTQLGSAEKASLVAALLTVQAEALESLDEPEQAQSARTRALELYLELQLAGTPPDPQGRIEAVKLLTQAGGADAVAERYRGAARLLGG